MVKFKINGKNITGRNIFLKAKKMNKSISGEQEAVMFLKSKGFKIQFFNTKTKRYNNV